MEWWGILIIEKVWLQKWNFKMKFQYDSPPSNSIFKRVGILVQLNMGQMTGTPHPNNLASMWEKMCLTLWGRQVEEPAALPTENKFSNRFEKVRTWEECRAITMRCVPWPSNFLDPQKPILLLSGWLCRRVQGLPTTGLQGKQLSCNNTTKTRSGESSLAYKPRPMRFDCGT